jgi:hypothetical protein
MASFCNFFEFNLNCSSTPPVQMIFESIGNIGESFYAALYQGNYYYISYNNSLNRWEFILPNTNTVVFYANGTSSSTPCDGILTWQIASPAEASVFCPSGFIPTIIDTDTLTGNTNNLFSGDCSCKKIEIISKVAVFYKNCNYEETLQDLYYPGTSENDEIIGCFSGTPLFYPASAATVTAYSEETCITFCNTGDTCCLNFTLILENNTSTLIEITPIGVLNEQYYSFPIILNDIFKYSCTIYYEPDVIPGTGQWICWFLPTDGSTGGEPVAGFILENDGSCPIGVWTIVECQDCEEFIFLETDLIDCPAPPPPPPPTPTPEPPPCLQGTNECNVITLFELGVKCNTTNAQSLTSSDGTATLTITGGTPPYVVLWDNLNLGQTIINLPPGTYGATVTDYYRDFSARTFCVVSANSTTTTTTTLKPPAPPKQLCFRIDGYISPLTFGLLGLQNGKPFYKSSTIPQYTLSWHPQTPPQVGYWDIFPPPLGSVVTSNNQGFIPTGIWSVLGGPSGPPPVIAFVNEGSCSTPELLNNNFIMKTISEPVEPVQQLSLRIGKNDTICGCEGSIILKAKGGVPPYNYSINNGLTYQNTPIFTNLCNGIYATSVLDDEGTIVSDTITINKPSDSITYFATLNTTFNTVQDNGTILNREYTTTLNITPPLADGVIVTLDIIHSNVFQTSPNLESAENNTTTVLYKNGEDIKPSGMDELSATTFNTIPGCQGENVYINTNSEIWETIEITNTDTITLVTSTVLTRNTLEDCYFASSDESYSILNLKLQGCGCCNIISE